MTPAQKMIALRDLKQHIQAAITVGESLGIKNLFYNEGYVDLLTADKLGHVYNHATQGPDGYGKEGEWCEYKTINAKGKDGEGFPFWKGGTFQFHWLSRTKIEKYSQTTKFFFTLRDGADICEVWSLDNKDIFPLLRKKAEEKGTLVEGKKKINAHLSFTLEQIKALGARREY